LEGKLEMGHARAILPLSATNQAELAKTIVKHRLSVRETEARVKQLQNNQTNKKDKAIPKKDANIASLETQLSEKLGAKVDIKHNSKGKGELKIHYHSADELDGILKYFQK